jgi:hypothetical protein
MARLLELLYGPVVKRQLDQQPRGYEMSSCRSGSVIGHPKRCAAAKMSRRTFPRFRMLGRRQDGSGNSRLPRETP